MSEIKSTKNWTIFIVSMVVVFLLGMLGANIMDRRRGEEGPLRLLPLIQISLSRLLFFDGPAGKVFLGPLAVRRSREGNT